MATFIDGIAASENIDSSGERISVSGMDISSLPVDGVFNYEHESKHPDQVIGKVLLAKKIFSEKDCDDERQLYFWNKCQTAYVYVMGELFDDYKESAREVAGMFKYDNDKRDQNERNVMNFSIEGAKIAKDGINITKSIARKVTITVLPCNKAAVAEMVPAGGKKPKDDIDGLFKTETVVEIELFKTEDMGAFLENLKKSAPHLSLAKPADPRGTRIGTTKSGKPVHSHERIGNYSNFSSHDHKDAMNLHYNAVSQAKTPKDAQHHTNKMKLHMQASQSAEKRETRLSSAKSSAMGSTLSNPMSNIKKTMTAGGMGGAPSTLTGGAALAKECLDPKMHKGCTHDMTMAKGSKALADSATKFPIQRDPSKLGKDQISQASKLNQGELNTPPVPRPNTTKAPAPGPMMKSEFWLDRAAQEYASWSQREEFVKFMSAKNPNMTKTEIDVMGQTLALKKSLEAEKALESMTKALKFGTEAEQAAAAKAPAPKQAPKAPKAKAPELKSKVHTEVSHVTEHYNPKETHGDVVHLKTGHEIHGTQKGKFKAGDKVTAHPFMSGTVKIEHGHND